MEDGEIGDGRYESSPSFWFNAYSAWFGCDSPDGCVMRFTGYTYDVEQQDGIPAYTQNFTIEGCPALTSSSASCQLQQVTFPESFRGLSAIQMEAFSGDEEKMFFMDDLALGWTNTTCEAGMDRGKYP